MAKKGFGKVIAFAAVTGAVAAGVSYALRYKTFHSELEKDFREFEDGDEEFDEENEGHTVDPRRTDRNYISLHASKDEFKLAAKDMAEATKNVLKDASVILTDTAHEAVSAAVDTANIAISAVKTKRAEYSEAREDEDEEDDLYEDEGFLDEDYVDEDDLYDYARTEPVSVPVWKQPMAEDPADVSGAEPSPAAAETEAAQDSKVTATIEEDTL